MPEQNSRRTRDCFTMRPRFSSGATLASVAAFAPFPVDIHIPVGGASYDAAVQANAFLNKQLGNEEVDFKHKHTPHVTLEACAWRRRALRS